jgi:hypothetical protein
MVARTSNPKMPTQPINTPDAVKDILKKYEFRPEFFPNIKQLLKKENSIHRLKILKQKTI